MNVSRTEWRAWLLRELTRPLTTPRSTSSPGFVGTPTEVVEQVAADNPPVIESGVKAGDPVIIEIPQALQAGATVRIAGAEGAGEKGKGKGKKKAE